MAQYSGVVRQETSTLSSDGMSWLRIVVWRPDPSYTKRAIVQLVHGMSEHIGRYDAFARFLADLGYVVFGHDHIGHGKSVVSSEQLGHMPAHGGKDILVNDIDVVRKAVYALIGTSRDLPLFLFGHSMGSFVARVYAARHPESLAGVILCGTGSQSRVLAKMGCSVARIIAALRGEEYRSHLVDSLVVGSYAQSVDNPRTNYDWLSSDPSVVDAYYADPLSGSHFSVGAYATLTDTVAEAVSKQVAQATPNDLPMLFVAGDEDPVGNKGVGVEKAANRYRKQGVSDVEVIIYPGMRHEILNEPDRMQVYCDVEAWMAHRLVLRAIAKDSAV